MDPIFLGYNRNEMKVVFKVVDIKHRGGYGFRFFSRSLTQIGSNMDTPLQT